MNQPNRDLVDDLERLYSDDALCNVFQEYRSGGLSQNEVVDLLSDLSSRIEAVLFNIHTGTYDDEADA